jgi:hypothetical protein
MPNKKSPKAKPKSPAKKMKAAPKLKAAKAKTPSKFPIKHHAENSGRGFMWKLLEQKQAEHKQRGNMPPGHMPESENSKLHDEPGHSRFNGPRRRVG